MSGSLPLPDGVADDAWAAIGARASGDHWRIPERSADGAVIGWAIRRADGSKGFVPGGHRGLSMAWPLGAYIGTSVDDPLFIVEGATCTASGMGLSLDIIGRPSATETRPSPLKTVDELPKPTHASAARREKVEESRKFCSIQT